jgi:hypothetical protein
MNTNQEDSTPGEMVRKKCPFCSEGIVEFHSNQVGADGECNNESNCESRYAILEVINLEPFTVRCTQEPLCRYIMPTVIPHVITQEGIKFSTRDPTDGEEIKRAVLESVEAITDWFQFRMIEAMEWTEVDWHEYEELDDGVSELVLENPE